MTLSAPIAEAPNALDDAADHPADSFDLPVSWSSTARDTFREVLEVRPDLAGAELAALEQACELISTADALDTVARAADYVATGSQGQAILHPAVTEARLSRTSAAAILARLVAVVAGPRMTNSERGRAAARARWSNRAVR